MHSQSRERRFEGFASYIVEIDIDPIRRLPIQLFEYRTGFVIEGAVEPTFLPQKLDLFRRTGRSDNATPAQFRQLPGHIPDGAGGSRNRSEEHTSELQSPC